MSPIRIVIGTEARTEVARKVLEYSILKTASQPVEFHTIMGEDHKDRGTAGEGTGFSFLRFIIPEMFDYQGHGIYLDADQLVLSDIAELWQLADENIVKCCYGNESPEEAETSVMVINCLKAKGKIKTIAQIKEHLKDDVSRKKYRSIMKISYLEPRPVKLSKWWNVMDKGNIYSSLNDFRSKKAKLIHYTDVRSQPWYIPKHPCRDIWESWLKLARKDGYISGKEIEVAITKFDLSNPRRPNGMHPYWAKYI